MQDPVEPENTEPPAEPTAAGEPSGTEQSQDLEPAAVTTPEGADAEGTDAFGDGPGPGLEHEARLALVTLMTQRFVTRAKHPAAWDALLAFEDEIRERLDDLFLTLEVDRHHEVAFKRQVSGDGIPVLLRRDRALSRDASLLLIHLRQEHVYHDAVDDALVTTREAVADFLNRFTGEKAHDQVQLDRRVDVAIRALEQYHLLDADTDDPTTYTVSPAVVSLVTPEVLAHLRDAFKDATGRALGADGPEEVPGPEAPGEGAEREASTAARATDAVILGESAEVAQ